MNIETKFKVGDFVYLVAQIKNYKDNHEPLLSNKDYVSMGDLEIKLRKPVAFQIIERIIQTCPNGSQIHYRIRSTTSDAILQYLEIELQSKF